MKDIFEAIERLSARLSFRLEHVAKKKSWAIHFSSYTVSPQPGTLVRLFNTLIHLPKGYAASFLPRAAPESDGDSWHIDIRRNDGAVRTSWSRGVRVARAEQEYRLLYDGQPLSGEDIARILADLEKPGLSGVALDISRMWAMRFGRMPIALSAQLEAIKDVDLLDKVFDAIVNDADQATIERLLGAQEELPR